MNFYLNIFLQSSARIETPRNDSLFLVIFFDLTANVRMNFDYNIVLFNIN